MERTSDAGQRLDRCGHGIAHGFGPVAVGEVQQDHEAGGAFHECADRALVVLAHEQVAFPMAHDCTVVDFSWSFADHDHARDLTASFLTALRFAGCTAGSQATSEFAA